MLSVRLLAAEDGLWESQARLRTRKFLYIFAQTGLFNDNQV